VSLWSGLEESQVTPVWPHKSLPVFHDKLPFDENELYQSDNIVCSEASNVPTFHGFN